MLSTAQAAAPPVLDRAQLSSLDAFALAEQAGLLLVVVEGTHIRYASPALEHSIGYAPADLLGRDFSELLLPADRARVANRARARQGGVDEPRRYEVGARHRDGSARWFELEVTPVRHQGRSLGVAVLHDITRRKQAERELERAHDELELFSARVAHDLRGPLHSVQAFAHLLQEHAPGVLDDEARGYLTQILHTVEQADRLIGKLLDLSRLGRSELQRSEVDLDSLVRSIVHGLLARAPARRVALLVEPGLRARCDAALVCVLLANLLDNAVKFGAARDPLHLEVGSVLVDGELTLFVRDDGPGFDAAAARELFNPFVRLDASRGIAGHGLGLATARRIVERHGGRIWAESAPGQGATFFFTLG